MSIARLVYTTIDDFLRGDVPVLFRKRRLLAMLEEHRRISFNHAGTNINWKPRIFRNDLLGIGDGTVVNFPQFNRHTEAVMPYRGWVMSEASTKLERLKNRGDKTAIIKLFSNLTKFMLEDFRDRFCPNLVNVDGNAAGNTLKPHGMESMFSTSGATAGIGTTNDTYAGLSTTRANLGGTWTGTWPAGYGDSEYDAWSPLVLDYTDTAWTGTATWASAAIVCLRFGITHAQRNASNLDTILLERSLWNEFLELVRTQERIMVQRAPDSSKMVKLGFLDTMNLDGTDIAWEDGLASGVGYGFMWDRMHLASMQSQLIATESDLDLPSFSDRFALDFYGNLYVDSPKFFTKWMSI